MSSLVSFRSYWLPPFSHCQTLKVHKNLVKIILYGIFALWPWMAAQQVQREISDIEFHNSWPMCFSLLVGIYHCGENTFFFKEKANIAIYIENIIPCLLKRELLRKAFIEI